MELTNHPPNDLISTLPKRSYSPIIKQFHHSRVSTDDELNKVIKMNHNSITHINVGSFSFSTFGSLFGQPGAKRMPKYLARLRRIAILLRHKKILPNLIQGFCPSSSFAMDFIISKLKALHHATSLDLDLSSVLFCFPQHLKSLSLILSHFKKLNSFSITFPTDINNCHQLLPALFFSFSRLNSYAASL